MAVFGKLQWRPLNQPRWQPENQTDFYVATHPDWSWVRLSPALLDGITRWVGKLIAVRLVLRCSSYEILDIGTMKLVKDYRMVRER